jgi:hypothetical protein
LADLKRRNLIVWLYDGDPEFIGLRVGDATPDDGGYLVLFQLENGETRIFATRYPAKYVSMWRKNSKLHSGYEPERVLVSPPSIRYERIKRALTKMVSESMDECGCKNDKNTCIQCKCASMESIIKSAESLYKIAEAVQVKKTDAKGRRSDVARTA